ncbi:SusC/RagA family TonB-linked outer membrane protein [Parapedobacter sp. ISTM3]|uniref:SusC/RagA family TonB-linked outer membrane protein n=1 Tax=Parapedobacter sp. ISTM3 TaxID=2800130 RepID=UPI001906236F|nr:SusC/RagA family TonB-linked outer membrane protein [Parapedobacter sp. ISTM3]MBK1439690.1 SusC/RagA family TonB-linked outer membrane protein [Parapedobacter sp. ISTM3]
MKRFLFFVLTIPVFSTLYAQQRLSGVVQSASGNLPLEGASVKLVPGGGATTTDREGRFSLLVAGNASFLVASYMGYLTDSVAITNSDAEAIVIALQPIEQTIDEVLVSTGYERIPKERSTGAFSHIDHTTFNRQVSTDVLSRLEAVTSGYMVERRGGRAAQPLIRGLGTLSGPTEPLIIVDNFPYEGDLNNINPNDVEDITVLKDAAAASIWGARAANGVVVIRTRQGRYGQPVRIGVQANATVGHKPDLSYVPQMASADFIDVERMLFQQGYYNGSINSNAKPALSPVVELLIKRESASTAEAAEIDGRINALGRLDVRDDFSRYVYRPMVNQQYALNFEGGTGQVAWVATAGFDRNRDNLSADYQRVNLRLQNRYRPAAWFEITTGLRYTLAENKRGRDGLGDVTVLDGRMYPYAQLADQHGNPLPLTKQYRQLFIDETNAAGQLLDWSYYPLEEYKHIDNTSALSDVVATTQLSFNITPWLASEIEYQYEQQDNDGRTLYGLESYYTRNMINYVSQIDAEGQVQRPIPLGDILDLSTSGLRSHQARGKVRVNHGWRDHQVSALAGTEIRHAGTEGNAYRTYGYNDDILTFGTVDYRLTYPNYVNGSPTFIHNPGYFSRRVTRFISAFANGAYIFKDRYTLSASARRDASNLFGLSTNDQWNLFWSVGGAWNVSGEPFYTLAWLPHLRLRGTYGRSGNIDPAMVATTTIAYSGQDVTTLAPTARFDNYYNPQLRWETSAMLNVGLDFATASRRLSGSFEYFEKKGTDLFGRALVDYTAGVGRTVTKNVSSMVGRGFDLQLSSLNIDAAVRWQSDLKLSYYQDKVVSNIPATTSVGSIVSAVGGTTGVLAVEGRPVNAIFSYRWAGLDAETGDPMGYVDGEPSKSYNLLTGSAASVDDLVYHGSAIPTWFGNFTNTLSYRQFSVNFSLVYKFGYFFRRPSIRYSTLFSNWQNAHRDFAQRWQQPGDEMHTNVPSMVYPANSSRDLFYLGSEPLIERGDHVRLQYIQAAYRLRFSKGQQSRLHINDAQLYFNVNNVGILWRANGEGLDPDFVGMNALVTPTSYALGVRLSIN